MPILTSEEQADWPKDCEKQLTESEHREQGDDSNMASEWKFHLYLRWSKDKRLYGLWVLKFVNPQEHNVYSDDGELVSSYEEDESCRREYLAAIYVDPPDLSKDAAYKELLQACDEFSYLAE